MTQELNWFNQSDESFTEYVRVITKLLYSYHYFHTQWWNILIDNWNILYMYSVVCVCVSLCELNLTKAPWRQQILFYNVKNTQNTL